MLASESGNLKKGSAVRFQLLLSARGSSAVKGEARRDECYARVIGRVSQHRQLELGCPTEGADLKMFRQHVAPEIDRDADNKLRIGHKPARHAGCR